MVKSKLKIGLVLGGGGAKGFCHLGVAQALIEKDLVIDIVSGVSAGAIAGAYLCAGISPEETLKLLKNKGIFNFSKIHLPIHGLLSLDGLKQQLNKSIKVKSIEELPTPLIVAVSNLNEGKVEYRSEGPLAKLVLASSSIPVLFSPVTLDGKQYVDGGLIDNLPAKPLINICETIIGVNVLPLVNMKKVDNLIKVTQRMFQISIAKQTEEAKKHCHYMVEPKELQKYDMLDGSKADDLFELGYKYGKKLKIK